MSRSDFPSNEGKRPEAELPRTVEPIKLAEQQAQLSGTVALESLTRFRDLLYEPSGIATVQLQFTMDMEKRRIVTGQLDARVGLQCQRCLQHMQTTLTSTFSLGLVVGDEQAKQLPKELEPFLIDDFSADLWQLVEDELILVVPPYPVHDRAECPAAAALEAYEPVDEELEASNGSARDNPFDVLAALKKKDRH